MSRIFFIFTLLTALAATSQTPSYLPFPDSNACWNIDMSQGMCFLGGWSDEKYSVVISGDTVIDGQSYHKLFTPHVIFNNYAGECTQQNFPGYQGAFREDVQQRKVYYVPPSFEEEQLLYDFSMQVGDTVRGYLQQAYGATDVVEEVDSVLVGDSYRKRWLINPCYNIHLIEGIGSTYGLLKPSPGCMTDMAYYAINCFSLNGVSLYPEASTECLLITSASGQEPMQAGFRVFPNPSDGLLRIESSRPENIREIRIVDMTGSTVFEAAGMPVNPVNMGTQPGFYIMTVVDKENNTAIYKIIRCR